MRNPVWETLRVTHCHWIFFHTSSCNGSRHCMKRHGSEATIITQVIPSGRTKCKWTKIIHTGHIHINTYNICFVLWNPIELAMRQGWLMWYDQYIITSRCNKSIVKPNLHEGNTQCSNAGDMGCSQYSTFSQGKIRNRTWEWGAG